MEIKQRLKMEKRISLTKRKLKQLLWDAFIHGKNDYPEWQMKEKIKEKWG